jgi:hypothetical protein
MWGPYITKKFNCKKIIFVTTILGGLVSFHPRTNSNIETYDYKLDSCDPHVLHRLKNLVED